MLIGHVILAWRLIMDQSRLHMRRNGRAYKTEQSYVRWIKHFTFIKISGPHKNMGKGIGRGAINESNEHQTKHGLHVGLMFV